MKKSNRTQRSMETSEVPFQLAFESIPDPAFLWEQQSNGNIILKHVNKSGYEITGEEVKDLLGIGLEKVYQDRSELFSSITHTMETLAPGEAINKEMNYPVRKTGEKRWFLIDFAKPAEKYVLVIRKDITERKQAEEKLQKQREELSEFAHTMAHDLGNSLTTIQGYSELLKIEYNKIYVEKIYHQAVDMKNLLDRSLELANSGLVIKKTAGVDLYELVEKVANSTLPDHINFSCERLPIVDCDPDKVAQIFKNLFENAVIHGNPSKVEVKRKESNLGYFILIYNDGKQISPKNRSKLFQKGYTTKKGGLGLGLIIVKRIIGAHGWQIDLGSTRETSFRILIPHGSKN